MEEYKKIIRKVLDEGVLQNNRTDTPARTITGAMFEHDMSDGFPLLTLKSTPLSLVASELEFFIKGLTDKKRLQERNNHIRDEWCSPLVVEPSSYNDSTKPTTARGDGTTPLSLLCASVYKRG